jgi:hypothetical protein
MECFYTNPNLLVIALQFFIRRFGTISAIFRQRTIFFSLPLARAPFLGFIYGLRKQTFERFKQFKKVSPF